jgi:hypothetical protein
VGTQNGSILYNKENLYEAAAGGGYYNYAWQPDWAWRGTTSFPIIVGQWYYGVNTYNHAKQYVYRNGVEVNSQNLAGNIGSNTNVLYLGRRGSGPAYFTGAIDEVRMSNVARSAGWLQTTYNNLSNVGSFLTFYGEEVLSLNAHILSTPDSGAGYKWQVKACNSDNVCSVWRPYDVAPNFKVDHTAPTAPGNLTFESKTTRSVTLNFGTQTVEDNFTEYKIFYSTSSPVTISGYEHNSSADPNLGVKTYNGAANTTITGLEPETTYYFNIWAYDLAGNYTGATEIGVTTNQSGRAKTVMFLAGNYSADGATGQNSATDQNFASFNFYLAEEGVSIENAYVLFDAQFEAYANAADNYEGYKLALDICQEPCTANAWTGSGRAEKNDSAVLAYNEDESNQARLLLDVTNEVQLASYSGGFELEGQVGYHFKHNSNPTNSIASARAVLVVTYTYNRESPSLTNTVIYPLRSAAAGDSGARQLVQTDDCTPGSNCPIFSYQMDIPEYSVSVGATRLSQWYQVYTVNDSHGTADYSTSLYLIQPGVDPVSNTYVHEAALGNEQSNAPAVYYAFSSGYAENTLQQIEYYARNTGGGGNYYLVGGEVVETYAASSSAAVKTRTVSFPIGVINNGLTSATTSGATAVYFPENSDSGGNVTIKNAWFRIITNNYNDGVNAVYLETKVGENSTSTTYQYNYNTGGTAVKPSMQIIHVIPDADYAELAEADADTPVAVTLATANTNSANQGGTAAELMITYAYSDEADGYLSSLRLMAGQTDNNEAQGNFRTAITTFRSVFPEPIDTMTLLNGALLSSYFISDLDAGVNAN